jgi:hypothetical protein
MTPEADDSVIPILMCARVRIGEGLLIEDNLTGRCDTCGHTVQYRPHAPTPHVLRCLECAAELIQPDDEMFTTSRMVADAMTYFRKREH